MSNLNDMELFGETNGSKFAFGIDLGTTNSAISVVPIGTEPKIIPLKGSRHTMPSCVMWTGVGEEFIVGKEAYNNRASANVVYSVKSFMQETEKVFELKMPDGRVLKKTHIEISAEILKGLVKEAGDYYGAIKDVVVTVPAMFNDIGKKNTAKACELAGLNLLGILTEPTAASLCYDLDDGEASKDILVYDLGGGTFDVSLIRVDNGSYENDDMFADLYGTTAQSGSEQVNGKSVLVVGNGGDPKLGGDDIDLELYRIVENMLAEKYGDDVYDLSVEEKLKIILQLERFKKSGVDSTYDAVFPVKFNGESKVTDLNLFITPSMFKQSLEPIYEKTRVIIEKVIKESSSKVNTIVLVGGSTKNPYLKEFLEMDYPSFVINDRCEPDESVAMGASIQAKNLKFGDAGVNVTDSLPIAIGIKEGETLVQLIKKNKPFPTSASKDFTTSVDDQEAISVEIYQGDTKYVEEAVCLGTLLVDNLPKAKSGEIVIRINLNINANGILVCDVNIFSSSGDFETIHRSLELNLSGKQESVTKVLTKEEKLKKKWLNFAKTLEGDKKTQLLDMIAGFPNIVDRKTIMDFISDNVEFKSARSE